jgi:hypothetical protein
MGSDMDSNAILGEVDDEYLSILENLDAELSSTNSFPEGMATSTIRN